MGFGGKRKRGVRECCENVGIFGLFWLFGLFGVFGLLGYWVINKMADKQEEKNIVVKIWVWDLEAREKEAFGNVEIMLGYLVCSSCSDYSGYLGYWVIEL